MGNKPTYFSVWKAFLANALNTPAIVGVFSIDSVGGSSDKTTLQVLKSEAECLVERHTQQPCTRNSHASQLLAQSITHEKKMK